MGDIRILQLIEGARQARGLTVVIDVFRAFTLECYLYEMGAREIRPIGAVDEVFRMRDQFPGCILAGERGGKRYEGFDFGNSPSQVVPERVKGRVILHTTSAGTQGIVNAVHADQIITGSLVNAGAVAAYIRQQNPGTVSLVCMGQAGIRPAKEDTLCAEYIRSILEGRAFPDIQERALALQADGGRHFFDLDTQEVYPREDFFLSTRISVFPFILRVERDEYGFRSVKIPATPEAEV